LAIGGDAVVGDELQGRPGTHQPNPYLVLLSHSPADGLGFPESPLLKAQKTVLEKAQKLKLIN
jgi:hypothetical protein